MNHVTTAAELARMTPAQQDDIFDRSVVTDLTQVPEQFLARIRRRHQQRQRP